jgi:hypothetical protein
MSPFLRSAGTAALALSLSAASAQASGSQIGTLSCELSGGVGLIVTSSQTMTCQLQPASGRVERYSGTVNRFGLDIGVVTGARMVWAVISTVGRPGPGALAGTYVGVTAGGTVGVGAGANLLVAGSERSFSLQPLSLQTQGGLNLAAGVSEMVLTAVR